MWEALQYSNIWLAISPEMLNNYLPFWKKVWHCVEHHTVQCQCVSLRNWFRWLRIHILWKTLQSWQVWATSTKLLEEVSGIFFRIFSLITIELHSSLPYAGVSPMSQLIYVSWVVRSVLSLRLFGSSYSPVLQETQWFSSGNFSMLFSDEIINTSVYTCVLLAFLREGFFSFEVDRGKGVDGDGIIILFYFILFCGVRTVLFLFRSSKVWSLVPKSAHALGGKTRRVILKNECCIPNS
jgi:hypothetical protein